MKLLGDAFRDAHNERESAVFHYLQKLKRLEEKRETLQTKYGQYVVEIQQSKENEKTIEDQLNHISEALYEEQQIELENLRHEKEVEVSGLELQKENLVGKKDTEKLEGELERIQGKIREQVEVNCELEEERLRCRTVKISDLKIRAFRKLQAAVVRKLDENSELWKKIGEHEKRICEQEKEQASIAEAILVDSDDLTATQRALLSRQTKRIGKISAAERSFTVKSSELKGKIAMAQAKVFLVKERLEAKKENLVRVCGDMLIKHGSNADEMEWNKKLENTKRVISHLEEFYEKVREVSRSFGFAEFWTTQNSLLSEWSRSIDFRNIDLRIIG
jgi:DNA repair exonuclease SbcCD ATPase subunit